MKEVATLTKVVATIIIDPEILREIEGGYCSSN